MAVTNTCTLVSLTAASLAAAQVLLDAAVAARVALGEIPERCTVVGPEPRTDGTSDLLALHADITPFQDWLAVTACAMPMIALDQRASVAAIQAAIDAEIAAQDLAGLKLRDEKVMKIALGGVQRDVLVMVFTDGAPAVS